MAPDLSKDPQSNEIYYLIRISLPATKVREIGTLKPGTPAEMHLKTGERPALSYFRKPLQDQINRKFKDK